MKRYFTEQEMAEFMGVSVLSLDSLGVSPVPEGVGAEAQGGAGEAGDERWHASRLELAELFAVHEDRISKWLPKGLGAAIVDRAERGGLVFDLRLAWRWKLAYDGLLNQLVLDDFKACTRRDVPAIHVLTLLPAVNSMLEPETKPAPKRRAQKRARQRRRGR